MADKKRTKTVLVDINVAESGFVSRLVGGKKDYNFSDIELLRKVLSNEKAKILYVLKNKKPTSIYQLAKILKRDFKSVYQDLKILERFKFIEFYSEKKGKRISYVPSLVIDSLNIEISI